MNEEDFCCERTEVHPDLLRQVDELLPPEEHLYDLAELFKMFGDSTRIRILFILFLKNLFRICMMNWIIPKMYFYMARCCLND